MTESVYQRSNSTENWTWRTLEDCAEILDSQRIPVNRKERDARIKGKPESELHPYYGATGQVGVIDDYLFDEELVLLGEDGAPFLDSFKEKAYIIQGKSWVNNHAHVLRALKGLMLNSFLCHYLNVVNYRQYVTGTTRLKLNQARMKKIPVPIPPLEEQKKIVAKIEELFTKLGAGVASLQNVKAQLQIYRQAVLKHAFNGKLTEDWRKNHKNTIEPATTLLEQITEEQKTEGILQKALTIDTSELPEIPEVWEWTNFSSITRNFDNLRVPVKKKDRKSMKGIYPYYGASGIIDYVDSFLFDGEYLLISEDGANLLARTKPIAFQAKGKFWVNNHAHVVKTMGGIPLAFLEHYFNYFSLTNFITGTAQPKLPQRAMNRIPIPIPPLNEQYEIVEEIERLFSVTAEIEKIIEANLVQSTQLRQSILKTAFEGNLVFQDSRDEHAERLLDRIKQKNRLNKRK